MKTLMLFLYLILVTFGMTRTTDATLYDRGGGLIYDDVFNITWLQDANYAETTGYDDTLYGSDKGGRMNWDDAMDWAEGLEYIDPESSVTYDNWRLPSAVGAGGIADHGDNYISELGHIFYYSENGKDVHDFIINLQADNEYWSSTTYEPGMGYPEGAWAIYVSWNTGGMNDHQFHAPYSMQYKAWAVHPGDIGIDIPEPATMLLLASGLVGVTGLRKKFMKR